LYNDKGNKIGEKETSGSLSAVTTFIYDNKNLLVQEDKWNSEIGKEQIVNYKYNQQGKIFEVKVNAYFFKIIITYEHTYDEAGRLIKLVERSSNAVSSTTTYEYNDNGLMVSETWKNSLSGTPAKTTYQINFK
jgi:YD repeat-containing protein